MKYILLLTVVSFVSCTTPTNDYCDKELPGKDGFMLQGGILDKYDGGRTFLTIERVNDPKDWAYNEYFTGTGFSKDQSEVMRVLEKDSCELKEMYFKFITPEK